MSETTASTGRTNGRDTDRPTAPRTHHPLAATDVVHESYSFACMRCGHGWEQSYAIEHHLDAEGGEFVTYVVNGTVVPSPLSRPSCQNCGGHIVRIMRAGRVSSVLESMHHKHHKHHDGRPAPRRADAQDAPEAPGEPHRWHLSDLLHPFQHRTG